MKLIQQHQDEFLALDLTHVRLIPSGLLGLLASIRNLGVEVRLDNPSSDILDVLEITKLDQILQIHFVDIAAFGIDF